MTNQGRDGENVFHDLITYSGVDNISIYSIYTWWVLDVGADAGQTAEGGSSTTCTRSDFKSPTSNNNTGRFYTATPFGTTFLT